MRLLDLIRRAARSLRSAKTRTLLTVLALAVGAFVLTLTLGASNGAQQYANTIVKDNFDPTELIVTKSESLFNAGDTSKPQVHNPNFGSITSDSGATRQIERLTDSDLSRLQRVPGVAAVRPAVAPGLEYVTRDGQKKYEATAQAYDDFSAPTLLAGRIPATLADGTLILPEGFVSALGFTSPQDAIGKTIRLAVSKPYDQSSILSSILSGNTSASSPQLATTPTSTEILFRIIAVTKKPSTLIQASTGLYLRINSNDITKLNDYTTAGTTNYHKYLSAYVKVTDGGDPAKLNALQAQVKKLGYSAQSVLDTQKAITQVLSVLSGIVTVFGVIALIASVFGVINTMYISVLQRTREIGLMEALGMHKKDINKLFLFEAGLIGLLGGLIGSALAIVAGTLLNPAISKALSLGEAHLLIFRADQIGLLLVALILVAILAGLFPARKASRLDPIEALRTE